MKTSEQSKSIVDVVSLDLENPASLMQFLQQPTLQIAEFLTGMLVSDKKDWKLSAGHLIQATIKGGLLTQLGNEIKKYQSEGKIKENFFETDINRASFKELLGFIDSETPDEIRFKAIKSIFFVSVAKKNDEMLAYEFLQTAQKLSSTEILILKANFEIAKGVISKDATEEGLKDGTHNRLAWMRTIARQMGYGDLDSVVIKYEGNLESLGLISYRHAVDRFQNEFVPTSRFRLTEIGYRFCEFMTLYE